VFDAVLVRQQLDSLAVEIFHATAPGSASVRSPMPE
jgi:hypothetical protein